MGLRADLHTILKGICENVYFQQPENLAMAYPCIVYKREFGHTDFADNTSYNFTQRYLVTYIDRDPDASARLEIAALPQCVYDRHYTADDLHHDVFKLFF